jgi:hypothetical protein
MGASLDALYHPITTTKETSMKQVIIHHLVASNDVFSDHDWEGADVAVAIDHDTGEVIGADVSETRLGERLRQDGWVVLWEDDEFVHDGTKWVRKP